MVKSIPKIGILGAGSWGGTLGWLLSNKNYLVTLWTNLKDEYDLITKTNSLLRPKKIKLNRNIKVTSNLKEIANNCEIIIFAVPTFAFKSTAIKLKKIGINNKAIFLSATKGITQNTYERPSSILKKLFPKNKYAVLSGPNIALDVISKTPVISVIASKDYNVARHLQKIISSNNFRIYINKDIAGVETAGALKNVVAIAAGLADGFGFTTSTKAALMNRGLIEITKVAIKEGAKPITLLGASGVGDLIATCCSTNSRNYKVGYNLAKGKKLKTILKELGQVAEGIETVKAMVKLGKKYKIDVPIANAVYKLIYKNANPKDMLKDLLKRPLTKNEFEF